MSERVGVSEGEVVLVVDIVAHFTVADGTHPVLVVFDIVSPSTTPQSLPVVMLYLVAAVHPGAYETVAAETLEVVTKNPKTRTRADTIPVNFFMKWCARLINNRVIASSQEYYDFDFSQFRTQKTTLAGGILFILLRQLPLELYLLLLVDFFQILKQYFLL